MKNTKLSIIQKNAEDSSKSSASGKSYTKQCECAAILEEDISFYQKILNSSASSIMQERLVAVVSEFMLEHMDQFYPGSQEEYQIAIRFCAGGLSNLYRDWFSGKLSYTLEELTRVAEALIQRIIGKGTDKHQRSQYVVI